MKNNKTKINYPLRLTVIAMFALLVLKVIFFFGNRNILYLISFFQDSFLLITNYFLFVYCFRNSPRIQFSGTLLFYSTYLLLGAVSFIYTIFLQDLITLPVNLFCITIDHIRIFFRYFLDLRITAITVSGIVTMLLLARFFPFRMKNNRKITIASIILVFLFIPTLLRPALNPIVASALEQYMLSVKTNHDIVQIEEDPLPQKDLHYRYRNLNKSFDSIPGISVNYKRIVVFVMESITYKDFMNESLPDKGSFLNRYRENIILFDNYYTLNLDSYTSLLAMLNSIFIPYQAYVDNDQYSDINNGNNIVKLFNSLGFKTLFLTSYGIQQENFLPDKDDWTQKTFIDTIPKNSEYASVTSNKIEYGSEDLSVFGDLIKFLKENDSAFVMQEMVFGHTVAWEKKTGIKPVDYYSRYFNKTIDELKRSDLLEGTLIAVVSDHGPRNQPYNTENYNIPLLIYSEKIAGITDSRFLSHIDFKDILLNIAAATKFDPPENGIYTIGNSGEMTYGTISKNGNYIFINNRMRTTETNTPTDTVLAFNKDFIGYRRYFESVIEVMAKEPEARRRFFNFDIRNFSFGMFTNSSKSD